MIGIKEEVEGWREKGGYRWEKGKTKRVRKTGRQKGR